MDEETCGERRLDRRHRKRHFQLGLAQIAEHLAQQISLEPYRVGNMPTFLKAKLSHCISPLRLYTDCLLNEVVKSYCPSDATVLDLGCGKGDYAAFFDRAGCHGFYTGLDVTPNARWRFWLKPGPAGLRRAFVEATAETLPLADGSVDFAMSACALEHFEDDELAVQRLFKVMRPGAHGIHFVPSTWSLFLYVHHGHRRYSPARLLQLFRAAGFGIVRLWGLGGAPSFLLHLIWITWLETGILWEILTLGTLPEGCLGLLKRLRVGPCVRQAPRFVRGYNSLLRLCLRMDRLVPFLPSAYAILVRKPL